MSNPTSAYASLVQLQEEAASKGHTEPALGRPTSIKYLREVSRRKTSFDSFHGSSFRSDKESVSHYVDQETEPNVKPKAVSMRRLYAMVAPDWIHGVIGTIGAIVFGAQMPLFALGVSEALVSYYMDWETTQRQVRKIAFLFTGGTVLTFFVHSIEHFSFGIMGERLTLRVREMLFAAILRNEIGWFDDASNNSSMLSSRLEADATLLRTIVVDRSTLLLQNISLVIVSFVIRFMLNWRITLVILAILFMKSYGGNLSKAYLKANMLAGEAVGNMRTVAAFCSEEKVIDLYSRELHEPAKRI
ncbi:hypothetical protein GIB67_038701 [Kingdonia uniflora]|uniref:ABC transmembrane type-1 domain-containing protein n=1 Tax=Kingdonia uniflora TaxID=39325 RepID=A0A7J7NTC0_9MAGN|nr:hypothetical protein GIB67_038701 [Kingdonia uniflora]